MNEGEENGRLLENVVSGEGEGEHQNEETSSLSLNNKNNDVVTSPGKVHTTDAHRIRTTTHAHGIFHKKISQNIRIPFFVCLNSYQFFTFVSPLRIPR